MSSFTLRTLLIAFGTWLSPVVGAFVGMMVAIERIQSSVIPSASDCVFAGVWGAAIGFLIATPVAAILAHRPTALPSALPLGVAWLGLGAASGVSLYAFVVSSAAI